MEDSVSVVEAETGPSPAEHKSSRLHSFSSMLFGSEIAVYGVFLDRVCAGGPLVLGRIKTITKNANNCWINQKLHMLAVCIDKKYREVEGHTVGADESESTQEDLQIPRDISASHGVSKEGSGRKNDRYKS
ncbi:hypothetical protein C2S51_036593 [Perilla frutescens var. frutescens]|nr:hypothetical protein C2S51_036593 [Perilla frutescens var. frutescens]